MKKVLLFVFAAGSISNKDFARASNFECLGFVDDPKDFYQNMDIILNPNIGGSGLKIKSIEALAFGKPLIATHDAMIGIPTTQHYHSFKTIDDFCTGLAELCKSPDQIARLGKEGQAIFLEYQQRQQNTLQKHFPSENKGGATQALETSTSEEHADA